MSGIINLLKNIIGGIFSFLSGLFGKKPSAIEGSNSPSKKSKSGYFLELDDSQSVASAVTSAVLAPATHLVEAIADSGNGTASTQTQKTTRKEKLAAKASNGNAASTTATKAPAEKSVPVEAVVTVPSEVGFATKYPIQISGGRRRPGANMTSYLDMARQMK